METIDLNTIRPAEYNPRRLSTDALDTLKDSITSCGVLKPILVNGDNRVIIAGHQRTRAMREMGYTSAPGFVLHGLKNDDEVRFNQLHNQIECEFSEDAPQLRTKRKLEGGGREVIQPEEVEDVRSGNMSTYVTEIGRMINKFGHFGAPVATADGDIIISSAYAYAALLLRKAFEVFVIPTEAREKVVSFFSKEYGVFSYDNITRTTYIQTLAQMPRLAKDKSCKQNKSSLYELSVIPWLYSQPNRGKDLRLLDFGAGRYDYARMLEGQGYNIHYVDPYHRTGTMQIDFANNKRRFQKICNDLTSLGQYDVVICDSVLNSVDSPQAEQSVINTVRALCKPGGMVFISGRDRTLETKRCLEYSKTNVKDSSVHFYDENGFTAQLRKGHWFFQRLHTTDEQKAIGAMITGGNHKYKILTRSQCWRIEAVNGSITDDEALAALRFEFDMVLPGDMRYELGELAASSYLNRKHGKRTEPATD